MKFIDVLYGYLNHLPQEFGPPIVAFFLLFLGHLFSNLLSEIVAKTAENDASKMQIKRQVKWPIMLGFFILAYRQFPVLRNALDRLDPTNPDVVSIVFILILALALVLLRPRLEPVFDGIKSLTTTLSKVQSSVQRGSVILGILVFAAAFSLQFPEERDLNLVNGLALIGLGHLFAKISEQIVKDIYDKRAAPKIAYYVIFAAFMFEALNLFWLKLYLG